MIWFCFHSAYRSKTKMIPRNQVARAASKKIKLKRKVRSQKEDATKTKGPVITAFSLVLYILFLINTKLLRFSLCPTNNQFFVVRRATDSVFEWWCPMGQRCSMGQRWEKNTSKSKRSSGGCRARHNIPIFRLTNDGGGGVRDWNSGDSSLRRERCYLFFWRIRAKAWFFMEQ